MLVIYLMLLSYPFVVHFNLVGNSSIPFALVLAVSIFAFLLRFKVTAILVLVMLLSASIMLYADRVQDLYFLPPIVINLFIGVIFLNGLRNNHVPLIEKYIVLMEGKISDAERQYARNLTVVWVFVLFTLMIESIALTLFFSQEIWSLFTNFINYMILALMFVGEYLVRLRTFPDKQHMSFIEYIDRLRRIKLKTVVM